jgi:hypothetical protein
MKRLLVIALLIELADGSRIRGEVLSMRDGQYTVRSDTLGILTLNAAQVVLIGRADSTPSTATPSTPASPSGDTLQSIQASIAGNPSLMGQILRLQSDPQMQAVLSDPEIMRAVQAFDFGVFHKISG